MKSPHDLEALARQIRENPSEVELARLLAATQVLVATAVRPLVDPQDLADVVQEVLIRIVRSLERWEPDRGSFTNWTRVIARRTAVDHRRWSTSRVTRQSLAGVPMEDVGSAQYLARIHDASLIHSVHDELRARSDVKGRRVLAAARDLANEGRSLSTAAIAREAGLSESTARRALTRVRVLTEELAER